MYREFIVRIIRIVDMNDPISEAIQSVGSHMLLNKCVYEVEKCACAKNQSSKAGKKRVIALAVAKSTSIGPKSSAWAEPRFKLSDFVDHTRGLLRFPYDTLGLP